MHKKSIVDMHRILKVGAVLFGSISLHHTLISAKLGTNTARTTSNGKGNHFLRQKKDYLPQNRSAKEPLRLSISAVPKQFPSNCPPPNRSVNDSTRPPLPVAQAQQSPKYLYNLISPIGLRNRDGICFAIAPLQMLYAIPELHKILSTTVHNENGTSCRRRLLELFQAMNASDKSKVDKILKELLANSGYILGKGGHPFIFMENILAYLMREEPEVTQLFQMRFNVTSQPILDPFEPEERSLIMNSGTPHIHHERKEMTLLRLIENASIEQGIWNWFHQRDRKYYIINNQYRVLYLKDRRIETLPPYLLVEAYQIHPNDIPEALNLGPYTQNNQSANYRLIGVLVRTKSTKEMSHIMAYIKNGASWTKFDNEDSQQIPSLKNIEGKGMAFLYQRQ
jgi:hypothetical protein